MAWSRGKWSHAEHEDLGSVHFPSKCFSFSTLALYKIVKSLPNQKEVIVFKNLCVVSTIVVNEQINVSIKVQAVLTIILLLALYNF